MTSSIHEFSFWSKLFKLVPRGHLVIFSFKSRNLGPCCWLEEGEDDNKKRWGSKWKWCCIKRIIFFVFRVKRPSFQTATQRQFSNSKMLCWWLSTIKRTFRVSPWFSICSSKYQQFWRQCYQAMLFFRTLVIQILDFMSTMNSFFHL